MEDKNKDFLRWLRAIPEADRKDRLQKMVSGGVLNGTSARAALRKLQQMPYVILRRLNGVEGMIDAAKYRSQELPARSVDDGDALLGSSESESIPECEGSHKSNEQCQSLTDCTLPTSVIELPREQSGIDSTLNDRVPLTANKQPSIPIVLPSNDPEPSSEEIQMDELGTSSVYTGGSQSEKLPTPSLSNSQSTSQESSQKLTPHDCGELDVLSESQDDDICVVLEKRAERKSSSGQSETVSSCIAANQLTDNSKLEKSPVSSCDNIATPSLMSPKDFDEQLMTIANCIHETEEEMSNLNNKLRMYERFPPQERYARIVRELHNTSTKLKAKDIIIQRLLKSGVLQALGRTFYPKLLSVIHARFSYKMYSSLRLATIFNLLHNLCDRSKDPKQIYNAYVAGALQDKPCGQVVESDGAANGNIKKCEENRKQQSVCSVPENSSLPMIHVSNQNNSNASAVPPSISSLVNGTDGTTGKPTVLSTGQTNGLNSMQKQSQPKLRVKKFPLVDSQQPQLSTVDLPPPNPSSSNHNLESVSMPSGQAGVFQIAQKSQKQRQRARLPKSNLRTYSHPRAQQSTSLPTTKMSTGTQHSTPTGSYVTAVGTSQAVSSIVYAPHSIRNALVQTQLTSLSGSPASHGERHQGIQQTKSASATPHNILLRELLSDSVSTQQYSQTVQQNMPFNNLHTVQQAYKDQSFVPENNGTQFPSSMQVSSAYVVPMQGQSTVCPVRSGETSSGRFQKQLSSLPTASSQCVSLPTHSAAAYGEQSCQTPSSLYYMQPTNQVSTTQSVASTNPNVTAQPSAGTYPLSYGSSGNTTHTQLQHQYGSSYRQDYSLPVNQGFHLPPAIQSSSYQVSASQGETVHASSIQATLSQTNSMQPSLMQPSVTPRQVFQPVIQPSVKHTSVLPASSIQASSVSSYPNALPQHNVVSHQVVHQNFVSQTTQNANYQEHVLVSGYGNIQSANAIVNNPNHSYTMYPQNITAPSRAVSYAPSQAPTVYVNRTSGVSSTSSRLSSSVVQGAQSCIGSQSGATPTLQNSQYFVSSFASQSSAVGVGNNTPTTLQPTSGQINDFQGSRSNGAKKQRVASNSMVVCNTMPSSVQGLSNTNRSGQAPLSLTTSLYNFEDGSHSLHMKDLTGAKVVQHISPDNRACSRDSGIFTPEPLQDTDSSSSGLNDRIFGVDNHLKLEVVKDSGGTIKVIGIERMPSLTTQHCPERSSGTSSRPSVITGNLQMYTS